MALTRVKNNQLSGSIATSKLASGSSFLTSVATANLPAESILQTVTSGIVNSQFTTTSGSYVTANCNVNITPSATSSKILVFANVTGYYIYGGGTDHGGSGAIYRDSTELYGSNARFGYQRDTSSGSLEIAIPLVLQHLDSPSTTSQIAYGIYMSAHSEGTVWTNNHDRCIIAMEIKG